MSKDKCDKCKTTSADVFMDFDNGAVLCGPCNLKYGDEWEKKEKGKCDKCGKTKISLFSEFTDDTMICEECEEKYGEEWDKKSSEKIKNNKNIGGWIQVFIVFIIIGFVTYIIDLFYALPFIFNSSYEGLYIPLALLQTLIVGVGLGISSFDLLNFNKRALSFVRVVLGLSVIFSFILFVISSYEFSGFSKEDYMPIISLHLRTAFISFIWFMYAFFSKKLKYTYNHPEKYRISKLGLVISGIVLALISYFSF